MSITEKIMNFKCSICLERFQDPIILNCGHTFDRLCIELMIETNQSYKPIKPIKCPLCSWTFDPAKPLISNRSLTRLMRCETTYEWFLIDISSSKERDHAAVFLKRLFNRREIFHTNHITLETNDIRMNINAETNFEHEIRNKSLKNLENVLREICAYLQDQNGLRKICLLTDGSTKHSKLTKINSNIIHQRLIIHIGEKNPSRTRELADQLNFQFGYFTEKTLENYLDDFLHNF